MIGKLELDIVVDIEFNAPEQMYMSLRLKRRRREVQELVARVDKEIDNRYGQVSQDQNMDTKMKLGEEKELKEGNILIGNRAPPSVTHLLLGIKARTGVIDDQIGQNG